MARVIAATTEIEAVGTPPKRIRENVGAVNSGARARNIAHMASRVGWREPGQTPRVREVTLVLSGTLPVETRAGAHDVRAGYRV